MWVREETPPVLLVQSGVVHPVRPPPLPLQLVAGGRGKGGTKRAGRAQSAGQGPGSIWRVETAGLIVDR